MESDRSPTSLKKKNNPTAVHQSQTHLPPSLGPTGGRKHSMSPNPCQSTLGTLLRQWLFCSWQSRREKPSPAMVMILSHLFEGWPLLATASHCQSLGGPGFTQDSCSLSKSHPSPLSSIYNSWGGQLKQCCFIFEWQWSVFNCTGRLSKSWRSWGADARQYIVPQQVGYLVSHLRSSLS